MVRELAGKYPQTLAVFEKYGIDYCCGGEADIASAADVAGANLDELLADLDKAMEMPLPDDPELARDWWAAPASDLADYVESRHHAFLWKELPRLSELLAKVRKAHAARHGAMLDELSVAFTALRLEMEQHLAKEEKVLFPLIRDLDAASHGGEVHVTHSGSVIEPIGQLEREHESAGETLEHIRTLTDDYTLPDDACPSFVALYDGLKALEADLHRHIHLENNILYPKAMELEEFDHLEATENVPVSPT